MTIQENVSLAKHISMKLGGPAKYLATIKSEEELLQALSFADLHNLKFMVIGGGTNIIFGDNGFDGLVIVNQIKGMNIDIESGLVEAYSGEDWDDLVKKSLESGLVGLESLSAIPGSAGAAPVNNIGAYGQEIKNVLERVRVFDTTTHTFVEMPNDECNFSYRNSIFKSALYGRYVITKIYLRLVKAQSDYDPPKYASLTSELQKIGIEKPTPEQVRKVVMSIRSSKLPDPSMIPNAGSFFKNPIVPKSLCDVLLSTYPEMPYFEDLKGVKLSAGWLIDHAGLRGYEKKGIKIYDKQALVLVNTGAQSFQPLKEMKEYIQSAILEKYGISLEPEPEIIDEE